jgi:hypothetical protein
MEIEEHQRTVLYITTLAIQDGLTTLVKTPFILFVRVISVSKIQQLCNRFIPPNIYNNGCCMINTA